MLASQTIIDVMARQNVLLKLDREKMVTIQDRYGRRIGHHVQSSAICDARIFLDLWSRGFLREMKEAAGQNGERFFELNNEGLRSAA